MYQVPEEIQSRSGVDTDADRVRGIIIASSFLEVANKPANLRKIGAVASIIGVGQLIFEGETVENSDWENELNWKQYGGGTVEICDQTDVEQAAPTENTKATSALRAWQGFVFWCKNTVFAELNTTAKTVIGALNEYAAHLHRGQIITPKGITLNVVDAYTAIYPGDIGWNDDMGTIDVGLYNGSFLQLGQETMIYGKAQESIANGIAVQCAGVQGRHILLKAAVQSEIAANPHLMLGISTNEILQGNFGYVTHFGRINDVYTTGLSINDKLYYDSSGTTPGALTKIEPIAPYRRIKMATVLLLQTGSEENGVLMVRMDYGKSLADLDDVDGNAITLSDNDVILKKETSGIWKHITMSNVRTWIAGIFRLKTEIGDAHGFVNPPNTGNYTISNTGSSITLNLLANAGNYKINGTDCINTGKSIQFNANIGQNFVCIDSANLQASAFDIMDLTKTLCATVYWDGTRTIVGDELHLASRNLIQHKKEHDKDGTRFVSGFVASFGAGAANTFTITAGVISDEERYHSITAKTQAMICYRNVGGTAMLFDAPSVRYAKVSSNLPQWDNNGVQTALADKQLGLMWVYATNNKLPANSEIVIVQGQGTYATIAAAQTAPLPTITGMSIAEWKLLYRVIIRRTSNLLEFVQADDERMVTTGLAVSGGGLTSLPASQVTVSTVTGYTSTNQQSLDEELASNTLKGNTTVHTALKDADSFGVWDSVNSVFKRIGAAAIKAYVKAGLKASEVENDSANKTGANVKLVIDGLVNHYQQATAPTIASTPALKKDDTWLDTTTLIKYAYTADSNNVLNWVNVNQCGAEIPNVASGERVVTKSTTGVQVAKTLLDMQIAAGTIAAANWSTGQATYTGQQGQTAYDANYKYECIGTNKWIRTALMEARLQLYLSPDIDDSLGAKTSAELDTAYPTAVIGQRVWGLLFLYEKKTTNIWKKISAVTA
jgi:hypothetical protein